MNYFVFGLLFHNKWNNINKYSDKYRGQIVTNRMVKKKLKNAQTKNPQIITYEMEHKEICLLKVKNL